MGTFDALKPGLDSWEQTVACHQPETQRRITQKVCNRHWLGSMEKPVKWLLLAALMGTLMLSAQASRKSKERYLNRKKMKWNELCFRPRFCTCKAILYRGQPGLMRWIFIMNHAPGAGSIAWPVDQQSNHRATDALIIICGIILVKFGDYWDIEMTFI